MRSFEYGDWRVGSKEMFYAAASVTIGVGVLSMPRTIANQTYAGDGIFSVLLGGLFALVFTFINTKLAARFPGKSFFEYSSKIVAKPIAYLFTFFAAVNFVMLSAYVVREIANIAQMYMFTRTPVEIIAMVFILVVMYAVTGGSTGILRLNLLFLPIIIIMSVIIQMFNITYFNINHIRPFFVTPPDKLLSGAVSTYKSFAGFEILLFYVALVRTPKKAPKSATLGIFVPIVLYTITYIFCIGVFSKTTQEILYPVIEMAKEIDAPITFFERFDSLFFTIWVMAIYTTIAMTFDSAVIAMKSLISRIDRFRWVIILGPIIYFIAMFPQNIVQVYQLGAIASMFSLVMGTMIPVILLVITKIRGVKSDNGSNK